MMIQRIIVMLMIYQGILYKLIYSKKLSVTIEENSEHKSAICNILKLIQNQTMSPAGTKLKISKFQLDNTNTYSLEYRKYIKLDEATGDVFLRSSIDREEVCQRNQNCDSNYTFIDYLIFADSEPYELQLHIRDVNDNYPTFQPDEKFIKIPEGIAKGTRFSLPIAKDQDSAEFGVSKYELRPSSNDNYKKYFKLQNESAKQPYLVVIDDIDRESINKFELYLHAIDTVDGHGKCKIVIDITDINDNTPQWVGLPYRRQIRECTSEELVTKLQADDQDDPSTDGGQIRFKISENTKDFNLISQTFFINHESLNLNKGALKSINRNHIDIIVLAIDGGGRRNETTISIDVIDCNDHSPQITITNSLISILENQKDKVEIARISVEDKDLFQNSNFRCELNDTSSLELKEVYSNVNKLGGGRRKVYSLSTKSGVSFDREQTPHYYTQLYCKDNGQPIMTSSELIRIRVTDQNDNAPKFKTEFETFTISEAAKPGRIVGRVIAEDLDSEMFNSISYEISALNKEISKTFRINNIGEILLIQQLDREIKERYDFQVLAIDSKNTQLRDSCKVSIIIEDVNDCAPEIDAIYRFDVVESNNRVRKYINLGKLVATDADNGNNGSFRFRIFKSKNSLSYSNRGIVNANVLDDGKLTLYGIIDREESDTLQFIVHVIDKGLPPLSSSTTVLIKVLDLNDNKPKFTKDIIHVNVSRSTTIGSVIVKLSATDPDLAENGTLSFRIIKSSLSFRSNETNPRYMIHDDGRIVLNTRLDDPDSKTNQHKLYYPNTEALVIQVSDQGTPALTHSCRIFIRYNSIASNLDKEGSSRNSNNRDNNNDYDNYNDNDNNNFNDFNNNKYNKGDRSNKRFKTSKLKWFDSNSLLIVLICVISAVIIAFTITIFFYLRHQCYQNRDLQSTKTAGSRSDANTHSISTYQHKNNSKINKDKSNLSLNNEFNTYTMDHPFPSEEQSRMTLPNNEMVTQYTNLTWLKNNFYAPGQGRPDANHYVTSSATPLLISNNPHNNNTYITSSNYNLQSTTQHPHSQRQMMTSPSAGSYEDWKSLDNHSHKLNNTKLSHTSSRKHTLSETSAPINNDSATDPGIKMNYVTSSFV